MAVNDTNIQLLLFDFDGVLIDTELLLYRLWRAEFARHDLLLTSDEWAGWRGAAGVSAGRRPDAAEILCGRAGLIVDSAAVNSQVRASYVQQRDELPMRDGVGDWIGDARGAGIRCAVVTNAEAAVVANALQRWGIEDAIEFVVARDEGRPAKPAPDGYLAAVQRAGVRPESAVAVEDSLDGIAAARGAGLRVLATPHKATGHLLVPGPDVAVVEPRWVRLDSALSLLTGARSAPSQDRARLAYRITASIRGLALGDALGKVMDKRPWETVDKQTRLLVRSWSEGQAPPEIFAGRVTDDTVLSLAVAGGAVAAGGLSRREVEVALTRLNPNGGRQLYKLKNGLGVPSIAPDGDSNGSVPRASVLGWVYAATSPGDLLYDCLKLTTLTHGHPDAVALALLQAALVGQAVAGRTREEMVSTAVELIPAIRGMVPGADTVLDNWCEEVRRIEEVGTAVEAVSCLRERHGLSVKAGSSALVALVLATTTFHPLEVFAALLTCEGGDLDSTMAIYGAVAGALRPGAFPASWTKRVEDYCGKDLTKLGLQLADLVVA